MVKAVEKAEPAKDDATKAEEPSKEEAETAELKKIADYLRGRKGIAVRHAVEKLPGHHDTEKRSEYFKGSKLIDFLCTANDKDKKAPKVKDRDEADAICQSMLREGYFHKCEKISKGNMQYCPNQRWEEQAFYSWDYDGSKTMSHMMTGALIVGFLAVTCFPIWPQFLKVWLWYLSVTLLAFMTVFLLIRFVLFLVLWVCGYEFWILPNLFDDTLSFSDSFKPRYSNEKVPAGQHWYRIAVFAGFVGFFYWAYTQPTDFDEMVNIQKQFMADLYEGNLLSDMSQQAKENIDKVHVPSVEELMAEDEEGGSGENAQFHKEVDPDEAEAEAADDLLDSLLDEEQVELEDDLDD